MKWHDRKPASEHLALTMRGRSQEECWQWLGSLNRNGYGNCCHNGKGMPAYRFAYEFLVGPVPDGLELDHLCRNPPCVNPAHLEPVTHQENIRRHFATITHCPQGHDYTAENTRLDRYGRKCWECLRAREKNRKSGRKKVTRVGLPRPCVSCGCEVLHPKRKCRQCRVAKRNTQRRESYKTNEVFREAKRRCSRRARARRRVLRQSC